MTKCDICKGSFETDQLVPISGKNVCAKCKPELVMNLKSGVSATPRIDPRKAQELKSRITRLNLLSFALAIPGLAMQVLAGKIAPTAPGATPAGALAIQGLGALLVIGGLVCYARMKGRSGVLGLLGLLSCLGLIILNFLGKTCQNCSAGAGHSAKECSTCGAPV
jgi:hypothetical protein